MLRRALVLLTLSLVCLALLVSCNPESEDEDTPIVGGVSGYFIKDGPQKWLRVKDAYKSKLPHVFYIPNDVTYIGSVCFKGCTSLKAVIIPDSVKNIGSEAFADCPYLASVELSAKLTLISDSTFSGCTSLKSIKLPEKILSIGNKAFYGSGLKYITIGREDEVCSLGTDAFPDCIMEIHVPEALVEAYKNHEDWKAFADKIVSN